MICLRAGRWQHSWTDGRLKCFLFWLCYKRYGKHFSRATIELWMHLGGLLSSQEANVPLCYTSSNSYASFVLSNLPRASITRWLHAARLPFLNCFASVKKQKSMHGSTWPVAFPPPPRETPGTRLALRARDREIVWSGPVLGVGWQGKSEITPLCFCEAVFHCETCPGMVTFVQGIA